NQKFHLDSTYTNANGDLFTPTLFKYFVSNIRLIRSDNTEYAIDDSYDNSYFLVNQDDEESMTLDMDTLSAGNYKAIKFLLGVDSTHNVSGAQSGALAPTNGMFWDWNTGYIFLKLEGSSPVIPTPAQTFTYHIGGFAAPNNNLKEIYLEFDGDNLPLANNTHPELHLVIDVLEILKNPTTINMATFPTGIMSANANAAIIANNYADMFTYDHIHAD
ncbi:MAG: MbnP family protein, partial [Chitinophagales bacterium]